MDETDRTAVPGDAVDRERDDDNGYVPRCIHGARMYECAEKCSYNARWHPWVVAVRYIRERRPKWASAR